MFVSFLYILRSSFALKMPTKQHPNTFPSNIKSWPLLLHHSPTPIWSPSSILILHLGSSCRYTLPHSLPPLYSLHLMQTIFSPFFLSLIKFFFLYLFLLCLYIIIIQNNYKSDDYNFFQVFLKRKKNVSSSCFHSLAIICRRENDFDLLLYLYEKPNKVLGSFWIIIGGWCWLGCFLFIF